MSSPSARPAVSVIVPFAGSGAELTQLGDALSRLATRAGDELIVADNADGGAPGRSCGPARVVDARGVRAAGFARNRGAQDAHGEWLVFLDADVSPASDLLDRYFAPPPDDRVAVLAGAIVDRPGADGFVARHAVGRGQMSHRVTLHRPGSAYAQSGNVAVRRSAFAAVGGFDESARSGEDADLCFRLTRAGWELAARERAVVEHPTSPNLAALLAQLARHGSGAAWLERRYPGEFPAPTARQVAARIAHAAGAAGSSVVRRRPADAATALLDVLEMGAFDLGRLLPNDPATR